jgi:TonB-linked SusC/RagA family outer membrane protein
MGTVFAQNLTVTGTVTSAEDGLPVIGASVFVQGTTNGAITDASGKYTLRNVPTGSTLVFSCIGMVNQTVTAAQVVNVVLSPDTEMLEQVVVTAQGLKRKDKAIGYSTVKIDAENLTIARQTDLGQSLAGKVSGARFYSRAGTNLDAGSIVLRGTSVFNSLSGSSPIYVIDGTIASQGALNMDDVESINILKGPAATALYGYQGANGAVIITTRSAKNGETHVEFSHTTTMEKYYNHLKLQREYGGGSYGENGQLLGQNDQYANVDTMSPEFLLGNYEGQNPDGSYNYDWGDDENWGPRFDPNVRVADALYWDPTSSKYMKADPWVAQFNPADMFQTGWTNTTNVAVSTSGKNYNTRISFTNTERTTIKDNTDAQRRYLSIHTGIKPTSWINVTLDYKMTYRKNHNASSDGYGQLLSPLTDFTQWGHMNVNMADYKDYMRPDGSIRTWNITSSDNFAPTFHDNPFAVMNLHNSYSATLYNVVTGDLEFVLPWNFKIGARLMGNITNSHSENRYEQAQYIRNYSSYYGESQNHAMTLTYQGRITWDKNLINDRLGINAAAFVEELDYDYGTLSANTVDGLTIPKYYNLAASNGIKSASNSETHYKTRSVYGNVTLGFDDTYFVDLSLRNDWDSRLPDAANHYLYGGASVSIMLNKFVKASWLDFWKLRASAAQVGATLGAYNTTYVYGSSTKYNGTIAAQSQSTTQLNPAIKPTISTSYEVGTEFRMFKNRLHGDINFYNRDTKNQILNLPVAGQTGYNTRQINTGLVRNRGVEFEIGGDIIRTRDFTWNGDFNIAKNVNTLVNLYPGYEEYFLSYNRFYYDFGIYANEGSPIGVMYTLGRWKRNDEGKIVVKKSTSAWWGGGYQPVYDLGGDPHYIGNFQPDWTGGFSTNFRYKNWNLGMSFDYTIGGQIFSYSNLWMTGSGIASWTAAVNDKGVNVREPVAKGGGVHVNGVDEDGNPVDCYMNAAYYFQYQAMYDNDHWMYDRTYLKMREVSLTYNFPRRFVDNLGIGLNSASLSFVASNPWLIYSAVPNFDPSESSTDWLEGGQNPSSRTFGFTFRCRF